MTRWRRRPGAAPDTPGYDPDQPFVLTLPTAHGPVIATANRAARTAGLRIGEYLANAQARMLGLRHAMAEPAADAAALHRLALWAQRYGPAVMPYPDDVGGDGFWIDISGAAHLQGGEAGLLNDAHDRLRHAAIPARLAIADTAGAAWALAHHGAPHAIVPPQQQDNALRPLPLAALRLAPEVLRHMRRLGFRRIGDLMEKPRAPFTLRFGRDVWATLDQALGVRAEPWNPLKPPPAYHADRTFAEPVISQDFLLSSFCTLLDNLLDAMATDRVGVRGLHLLLFRPDGRCLTAKVELAAATRDAHHLHRLIALRLQRLAETLAPDEGHDAIAVQVEHVAPLAQVQDRLDERGRAVPEPLSSLVDRLRQRHDRTSLIRPYPVESHVPERAVFERHPDDRLPLTGAAFRTEQRRPPLLLSAPEKVSVLAEVPEGAPMQFQWRRQLHRVTRAEGPERIAPEWWRREPDAELRDYYAVEDEAGRSFWIFRTGLHGDAISPQWFLHGLFP
jgi:protein ImuB